MWEIDPGTPVPAVCSNAACGLVFPSPFHFSGGFFAGNMTNCPRCGSPAFVANAISNGPVNGKLQVATSNADWQREAWDIATGLSTLGRLADALQRGEIDRKTAVAKASEISRPAATTLDWAAKLNLLAALLTIITAMITIYQVLDENADEDDIVAALKENTAVLEQIEKNQAERSDALLDALERNDGQPLPVVLVDEVVRRLQVEKIRPPEKKSKKLEHSGRGNRHERRANKARARKAGS